MERTKRSIQAFRLGDRLGLVMERATQHRQELGGNWALARGKEPLRSIAPLE